jgi:uncharacterized membrane protein YoaK (UPF0700 family)
VLAGAAGYVDAVGYLIFGDEFVAHMTGNTSRLGQHLGLGDLHAASVLAVAVVAFVAAVTAGSLLLARFRLSTVLTAEAAVLAFAMLYGESLWRDGRIARGGAGIYVVSAAAVAAMGVQSAVVLEWRARKLRTTFLTGMLTRLGRTIAALIRGDRSDAAVGQAVLIVALWTTFAGAGAGGALLLERWRLWSLAVPLGVLLAAAAAAAGLGPAAAPK